MAKTTGKIKYNECIVMVRRGGKTVEFEPLEVQKSVLMTEAEAAELNKKSAQNGIRYYKQSEN